MHFPCTGAQLHHDRRQQQERAQAILAGKNPGPKRDFLQPIIADGDTGHGGLSAVMKLTKLMVEAGAAGMHLEDQKPGSYSQNGKAMTTKLLQVVQRHLYGITHIFPFHKSHFVLPYK
jgi:isocitrate lyase